MNSKKNFFWICSLLLLSANALQAQSTLPARRPAKAVPKPRMAVAAAAAGPVVKDGLTMKEGRIILTEQGTTNPLLEEKKLRNGTTISTSGLVTGTDGTTAQMTEGDYVSLSGRIATRASIVEADSLVKIKLYDQKYPGKRKKMEDEKARKEKEKIKRDEAKAKMKTKSKRR